MMRRPSDTTLSLLVFALFAAAFVLVELLQAHR